MDIFTIVSGDFVYGAAALCNSLRASGFYGKIHVGYAGELRWSIDPSAPIILHRLEDNGKWIGTRKPNLILNYAEGPYAYIDADCIIMTSSLIKTIIDIIPQGPIFCAEGIVPRRDVRRQSWRVAKENCLGIPGSIEDQSRASDIYYNSGFFCGDVRRDRWMLDSWLRLIETSLQGSGDLFETPNFPMADQDCLNALLQDGSFSFYCISPPDVWYATPSWSPFHPVGRHEAALLHCTGRWKPWRYSSVRSRSPNIYERAWYHFSCEDTGWVRCPQLLNASVESWLRNGRWGAGISYVKGLAKLVLRGS
jgi:hypothetical protein